MKLFSIKDKLSASFGGVMMHHNAAMMSREIQDAHRGQDVSVTLHPDHFELWQIGDFNPETGDILPELEMICNLTVIFPRQIGGLSA